VPLTYNDSIVSPTHPALAGGPELYLFDLYRGFPLDVFFHLELNLVSLFQASEALCNDGAVMNKNVPPRLTGNKPVPLFVVKPLDDSGLTITHLFNASFFNVAMQRKR